MKASTALISPHNGYVALNLLALAGGRPQAMTKDGISRLSDGQRECLRLVLLMKSSKEIARELSISRHTVDQRLRVANQILGTVSRFEAARMLAVAEGGGAPQDVVYQASLYQTPYLLGPLEPAFMGASEPEAIETGRRSTVVQEVQAQLHIDPALLPTRWPLPLPIEGQKQNALSVYHRLVWIVALAIAAALAFGMLLSGLEALKRALS